MRQPAPSTDRRAELALLCRWSLMELDHKRLLIRVLMRDGDRLPELVRRAKHEWIEPSYAIATEIIGGYASSSGRPLADARAIAVVALGAIANVRLSAMIFAGPPLEVDDDRFVDAWVSWVIALVGDGHPSG